MNNNYTRFSTFEETIKNLNKITKKEDITKGGIPLCYDDDSIYLDTSEGHNLVIGGTGSGKTRRINISGSIITGDCFPTSGAAKRF